MFPTSLVRYKSLPNNGNKQSWKKKPKWVGGGASLFLSAQKATSAHQASFKLWTEIYFLPVGVTSIYKCQKEKSTHFLSFKKGDYIIV